MALPAHPDAVVVPIVSASPETNRVHELWGTGFFVAPRLLMSAKHVLGTDVAQAHELAAVHLRDPAPRTIPVSQVYSDPVFDVAVARVDDWPSDEFLTLTPHDTLHMNRDVLTTEYSATERNVRLESGDTAMVIAANWHKGHVVRSYLSEFGHLRPTNCIDLSYPAFRRASGAPVLEENSGDVIGLIVANIERHLLPAHLERIERPDGTFEEVRYFLPNAQAIRASHLRATLGAAVAVLGGSTPWSS